MVMHTYIHVLSKVKQCIHSALVLSRECTLHSVKTNYPKLGMFFGIMLILEGLSYPLQGYSVSVRMNMRLQFRYLIPCPFYPSGKYLTIVSFAIVSTELALHDYL